MRRILHIIDSLDYTGTAQQLLVLAQGLMARSFDVHVVALDIRGPLAAAFQAAGVPTTQIARRWPVDPVTLVALQRHISRLRPAAVHTWNAVSGLYGRLAARTAGVKHVVAGRYRIDAMTSGWEWPVERHLINYTTDCVTNSPQLRHWYLGHGMPPEKIAVIPPGVLIARCSGVSRSTLLNELNLPTNARLIGVVSRLVPEKRVQDLIWAADLLRVLHDNLRMLVIGDGPLRQQLEQYARMASDLDHIRFLGQRGDLWRILPHLNVLWNGSDNRSVSIAMLETMAAGVPVVASDVAVNREIITHNETGFLIPVGNRAGRADRARWTDRIFTDAVLTGRIVAAACQRVRDEFAADQFVQRYVAIYDRSAQ